MIKILVLSASLNAIVLACHADENTSSSKPADQTTIATNKLPPCPEIEFSTATQISISFGSMGAKPISTNEAMDLFETLCIKGKVPKSPALEQCQTRLGLRQFYSSSEAIAFTEGTPDSLCTMDFANTEGQDTVAEAFKQRFGNESSYNPFFVDNPKNLIVHEVVNGPLN